MKSKQQSELEKILAKNGTSFTSLPDNLTVGGSLDLREGLSNISHKNNCGYSNRTIFAAHFNGGIQIVAGCFAGTIDKFFNAVDAKYAGEAATKYKNDGQECVNDLVKKLNR